MNNPEYHLSSTNTLSKTTFSDQPLKESLLTEFLNFLIKRLAISATDIFTK